VVKPDMTAGGYRYIDLKGADMQPAIARRALMGAFASALLSVLIAVPTVATADEGGVSFWLPGFFGSLAAAPQQPGWALTSIYYHTTVSARADVTRAREFEIGRIPVNVTADVNASLQAKDTVTGARITGLTNNTNSGWVAGGGIEWALVPNWSVKIEYASKRKDRTLAV
jgi:hypothetical protein